MFVQVFLLLSGSALATAQEFNTIASYYNLLDTPCVPDSFGEPYDNLNAQARYEGCKRYGFMEDWNENQRAEIVIDCLQEHILSENRPCDSNHGFPSTLELIQFYIIRDATTNYKSLFEAANNYSVISHVGENLNREVLGGNIICSMFDLLEMHRSVEMCMSRLSRETLVYMRFARKGDRRVCGPVNETRNCVKDSLKICMKEGQSFEEWVILFKIQYFVFQNSFSQYETPDCGLEIPEKALATEYESAELSGFNQSKETSDNLYLEKPMIMWPYFLLLAAVFFSVTGVAVTVTGMAFCSQSFPCMKVPGESEGREGEEKEDGSGCCCCCCC